MSEPGAPNLQQRVEQLEDRASKAQLAEFKEELRKWDNTRFAIFAVIAVVIGFFGVRDITKGLVDEAVDELIKPQLREMQEVASEATLQAQLAQKSLEGLDQVIAEASAAAEAARKQTERVTQQLAELEEQASQAEGRFTEVNALFLTLRTEIGRAREASRGEADVTTAGLQDQINRINELVAAIPDVRVTDTFLADQNSAKEVFDELLDEYRENTEFDVYLAFGTIEQPDLTDIRVVSERLQAKGFSAKTASYSSHLLFPNFTTEAFPEGSTYIDIPTEMRQAPNILHHADFKEKAERIRDIIQPAITEVIQLTEANTAEFSLYSNLTVGSGGFVKPFDPQTPIKDFFDPSYNYLSFTPPFILVLN